MYKWAMFALLLLLAGCGDEMDIHSTWIWDTEEAIENTQETIAFLTAAHVKQVYVQYDENIVNERYASFFQQLRDEQIEVYALSGSPSWTLTPEEMTSFTQWILTFQQQYKLLDGIHADIEPYILAEWEEEQPRLLLHYFELVTSLRAVAHTIDVPLQLAIPFWFDEIPYANTFGEGIVSEWLIDHADAVVIMAYRNEAQAVIPLVEQEIAYANSKERDVIIALETVPSAEGAHISFAQKSNEQLMEAVREITAFYDKEPAFAGIAIHSFHSWQARN